MNKIVVYTAIFNDYDWLKDPVVVPKDVDFVCYTDSDTLHSKVWKVVRADMNGLSPSLINRRIKLLYPYKELQDYDYSLYVDGSIMIKGDIDVFLRKYIPLCVTMTNFRHPYRDCIYDEIDCCIRRGSGDAVKLLEQETFYKSEGVPDHFGLSDNKVILRNHRSELGRQMMSDWYDQVAGYSGRDQVCLSYVLNKHRQSYVFFEENIEKNPFFENWPHNNKEWYIRYWRHFKWFCERHRIAAGLISYVDKRIKPWILAKT